MRRLVATTVLLLFACFLWSAQSNDHMDTVGQFFLDTVSGDNIHKLMENLTTSSHYPEYPGPYAGFNYSEYMKAKFYEYLPSPTVIIDQFSANVSYLVDRKISYTTGGNTTELNLGPEPGASALPFILYSPSGSVDAVLINVDDFETMEDLKGVDVKDKIILTTFGYPPAYIKTQIAQRAGALAVLFYTTAPDAGKAFPNGPDRPADSVQRDSMRLLNTDPTEPTGHAVDIPVYPLSYYQAEELIEAGSVAVLMAVWWALFTY